MPEKLDTGARSSIGETIRLALDIRPWKKNGVPILHLIQPGPFGGWKDIECRVDDIPKLIDALQKFKLPEN